MEVPRIRFQGNRLVDGQGLLRVAPLPQILSSYESQNAAQVSYVEASQTPKNAPLPPGCRVMRLSATAAPKEVLQVEDPRTGQWNPVHVFYDTGAEISGGTVDLLQYDTYDIQTVTDVIETFGFNTKKDIRFDQALVRIKGDLMTLSLAINCEHDSRKAPPNELLDVVEWTGERVALPPSEDECRRMPFILLGQPDSQLHPVDLSIETVPVAIRQRYPHLSWKRSRMTGKLLYWGTIRKPTIQMYKVETATRADLPYEFTHDLTPQGTKPTRLRPPEEDTNFCGPLSVYQKLKELNHDDILTELNSLVVPSNMSPHTGDVRRVGCWNCDPWAPYIFRRRANASYLVRQLKWVPWDKARPSQGGRFVLNRELSEKVKYFPSGSGAAKANLERLIGRLRNCPYSLQALNHGLEKDYKAGFYTMYTPEELSAALSDHGTTPREGLFLPLLFVYNSKSGSTPIRLLIDPSRKVKVWNGEGRCAMLSYNELISIPNYTLITPLEFGLQQTFLPKIIGMDIAAAFRGISLSRPTSLQNLTWFYRGPQNQPLMTPEGAMRDRQGNALMAVYAFDQLLFGQADAPSVLGISVDQCPDKWEQYAQGKDTDGVDEEPKTENEPIEPHVMADTRRVLKRPYVDDLMTGPPLPSYIIHALSSCPHCQWCSKCFDDCTKPDKQHQDQCRLYRDVPLPPLDECKDCQLCTKCSKWAKWVRPDQYGGVSMTAGEWEEYLEWLGNVATQYLPMLALAVLKVLQFSSFKVKSIDSNLAGVRAVHKNFYPPVEESKVWYTPKPDAANVRREGLKVKQSQPECFEDESLEIQIRDEAPFLVQMGKEFFAPENTMFEDRVGIKTRYLEISKVARYANSGPMLNQRSFDRWFSSVGNEATRRLLTSIAGSFYDPNNVSGVIIIPLMLAKNALFDLYITETTEGSANKGKSRAKLPGWDEVCPEEATVFLMKAVRAFYLLKDKTVRRANLHWHVKAVKMTVIMTDASVKLGATVVFVVTGVYINDKYSGRAQLAHMMPYICRRDWKSMPEKESTFLFRGLETSHQIVPVLESLGLYVQPEHVAVVTDSSATYIQLRTSIARVLTPKLGHLTAKSQSYLHSLGWNAIRNLYMFDQRVRPFPADLISKIRSDITDEGILKLFEAIQDYHWLEEHPSKWPIHRGISGKMDVTQIGDDLGIPRSVTDNIREDMEQAVELGGTVGSPITCEEKRKQAIVNMRLEVKLKVSGVRQRFVEERGDRREFYDYLLGRRSLILPELPRPDDHRAWNKRSSLVDTMTLVVYWTSRVRLLARRTRLFEAKKERMKEAPVETDLSKFQEMLSIDEDPTAAHRYAEDRKNRTESHMVRVSEHSPWCGFVYCNESEMGRHVTRAQDIGKPLQTRTCTHTIGSRYFKRFGPRNRHTASYLSEAANPRPHFRTQFDPLEIDLGQKKCVDCIGCEICERKGPLSLAAVSNILEDLKEPFEGDEHLVHTRTMAYAIAHFAWNEAWRPFLRNRVLDILCSVYGEDAEIRDRYAIAKTTWGVGHQLSWTKGRDIRDTSRALERYQGRAAWRVIDNLSPLAADIVTQLHNRAHHTNEADPPHQLEVLGIKIPSLGIRTRQAKDRCLTCRLHRVRLGNVSQLMKRSQAGPLDLATISNLNNTAPHSFWVCDTAGPMQMKCQTSGCDKSMHVVIFVQTYFRRVLLYLVPNLEIQSMIDVITALISTEGKVVLLVTDPAASLTPLSSDFGPLADSEDEENLRILHQLDKKATRNTWLTLLKHRYGDGIKELGVRLRISGKDQSHLQGLAEKVVERVKLYFSTDKVFKMKTGGALTEHDCRRRLYMIMHQINSIPFHTLSPGVRFSPNDLLGAAGRIAVTENFHPDPFQGMIPDPSNKVREALATSENIYKSLRADLFRFFLPLMRDDTVKLAKDRASLGSGDPTSVEDLTVGSIVVDIVRVAKNHSLRGSIARVEALTPGNRAAVISHLRQDKLKKSSEKFRRLLRKCNDHGELGCQVCLKRFVSDSTGEKWLSIDVRPTDRLYMVHREPLSDGDRRETEKQAKSQGRFVIPELGREVELPINGHFTFPVPEELLDAFLDARRNDAIEQSETEKSKRMTRTQPGQTISLDPDYVRTALINKQFRTNETKRRNIANEEFNLCVELKGGVDNVVKDLDHCYPPGRAVEGPPEYAIGGVGSAVPRSGSPEFSAVPSSDEHSNATLTQAPFGETEGVNTSVSERPVVLNPTAHSGVAARSHDPAAPYETGEPSNSPGVLPPGLADDPTISAGRGVESVVKGKQRPVFQDKGSDPYQLGPPIITQTRSGRKCTQVRKFQAGAHPSRSHNTAGVNIVNLP